MKEVDKDVVDFFNQELSKKEKREQKKIAKIRAKEKRKQSKKEKLLEQAEDIDFARKIEEKRNSEELGNSTLSELEKITEIKSSRTKLNENINVKKYPFLNFLLYFFIIILLIVAVDFAIYNVIKKNDIELIITGSLLCSLTIFYILSIIVKKESIKKIFQILATISIALYMCYQLFIV